MRSGEVQRSRHHNDEPTLAAFRHATAGMQECSARSDPRPADALGTRRSGSELIDKVGDEAGPAGLMRGAASAAIIAVEVFMKKDVILELRIHLKLFVISENRTSSVGTAQ